MREDKKETGGTGQCGAMYIPHAFFVELGLCFGFVLFFWYNWHILISAVQHNDSVFVSVVM